LGIKVLRDSSGFNLNQGKYILDVLKRFDMTNCVVAATLMVIGRKFPANDGEKMADLTLYCRAISSL